MKLTAVFPKHGPTGMQGSGWERDDWDPTAVVLQALDSISQTLEDAAKETPWVDLRQIWRLCPGAGWVYVFLAKLTGNQIVRLFAIARCTHVHTCALLVACLYLPYSCGHGAGAKISCPVVGSYAMWQPIPKSPSIEIPLGSILEPKLDITYFGLFGASGNDLDRKLTPGPLSRFLVARPCHHGMLVSSAASAATRHISTCMYHDNI